MIGKIYLHYNSYKKPITALIKLAVIGLILFAATNASAQVKTQFLRGKVFIENKAPAELSTVILLAADSSILSSTACDVNGQFAFTVKQGAYLLIASRIGYDQSLSGPYFIGSEDVVAPDITLNKSVPELKEVSVSARRAYVEVKPGRVVLNVQSSIVAEGNSVYEVLRQAPGVQIGSHGSISIIGRQSAMILIDGKPTNLTGENLTAILQGMQSSNVQQIELISNPSAKYDAGGVGVINIILKKGANAGTNGTFNLGVGYGKFYKATGGVTFNNRMGKVNIFGNYNYSANKSFRTFTTDRNITYQSLVSDYNSRYYTTRESFNHTFRLGSDFFLSPKHTLGVLVNGTINNSTYQKDNFLSISNNGRFDSTIVTMANLKRNLSNLNYDVNYSGKLDTLGQTLSADLSFNHFDRKSDEYIGNYFNKASGEVYRPTLFQQNLSPSAINIWAAKVDYTKPLSKNSQLETGLKYSHVESDNDLIFGPQVNGAYTVDPRFSSSFAYSENINAAYALFNTSVTKWKFTAGLRVEQTIATGTSVNIKNNFKKNYTDLFPQASIKYTQNEKNTFTLSFNRSIFRPLYEDINPFLYYVDLYDYRSGNPQLLPSYTNKLELAHLYKNRISTSLYASVTDNFYDFNAYNQDNESKVNVTTRENFGRWAVYGIRFFAPLEFTKWWNATFAIDASYQRIKAYAENGNLDKGIQDVLFNSIQSFTIGAGFSAEVIVKYESPTFYGVSRFKSNYRFDAGISKSVFNKMGTFRLAAVDLFRTERDRSFTNYQNLNLAIVNREEGRVVRFGFSYRFGNRQLKNAGSHRVSNEEEQRRTGNVAGSGN
ncbi:outer membrane beta-barrel family protein [Mucilaginibacter auburnensis]|uniref:Outer membrane receptor protein involved in Fe transport n=1 Tax=Mucilaginibacter auburnensis TaxID=1457233 RepID=A0A2H9VPU3_9SPHI|nr:outer membrane beta-barrel family protein [Mucilaginibacter auburnensis]PJJ80345.1 outer membrane receptor protein involved in Fe transport [Mucilaginibacter auburnensis]